MRVNRSCNVKKGGPEGVFCGLCLFCFWWSCGFLVSEDSVKHDTRLVDNIQVNAFETSSVQFCSYYAGRLARLVFHEDHHWCGGQH